MSLGMRLEAELRVQEPAELHRDGSGRAAGLPVRELARQASAQ